MFAVCYLITNPVLNGGAAPGQEPIEIIDVVPSPRTSLGKDWCAVLDECNQVYCSRWRQQSGPLTNRDVIAAEHLVEALVGHVEDFAGRLPPGLATAIDLPTLERLLDSARDALAAHHRGRATSTDVYYLETATWNSHEFVLRVGDRLGLRQAA